MTHTLFQIVREAGKVLPQSAETDTGMALVAIPPLLPPKIYINIKLYYKNSISWSVKSDELMIS
jgi:hypothetical protein